MIIQHLTSIECAYVIVSSGQYRPISSNPLHGDVGLNCFNGSNNNHYENVGVILNLEWSGPKIVIKEHVNLPKNTLVDNGPWRLIVPSGTDKFLTFDSLTIEDVEAFNQFVSYNTPWYFKIPFSNWLQKRKNNFVSFFANLKGKEIVVS